MSYWYTRRRRSEPEPQPTNPIGLGGPCGCGGIARFGGSYYESNTTCCDLWVDRLRWFCHWIGPDLVSPTSYVLHDSFTRGRWTALDGSTWENGRLAWPWTSLGNGSLSCYTPLGRAECGYSPSVSDARSYELQVYVPNFTDEDYDGAILGTLWYGGYQITVENVYWVGFIGHLVIRSALMLRISSGGSLIAQDEISPGYVPIHVDRETKKIKIGTTLLPWTGGEDSETLILQAGPTLLNFGTPEAPDLKCSWGRVGFHRTDRSNCEATDLPVPCYYYTYDETRHPEDLQGGALAVLSPDGSPNVAAVFTLGGLPAGVTSAGFSASVSGVTASIQRTGPPDYPSRWIVGFGGETLELDPYQVFVFRLKVGPGQAQLQIDNAPISDGEYMNPDDYREYQLNMDGDAEGVPGQFTCGGSLQMTSLSMRRYWNGTTQCYHFEPFEHRPHGVPGW